MYEGGGTTESQQMDLTTTTNSKGFLLADVQKCALKRLYFGILGSFYQFLLSPLVDLVNEADPKTESQEDMTMKNGKGSLLSILCVRFTSSYTNTVFQDSYHLTYPVTPFFIVDAVNESNAKTNLQRDIKSKGHLCCSYI